MEVTSDCDWQGLSGLPMVLIMRKVEEEGGSKSLSPLKQVCKEWRDSCLEVMEYPKIPPKTSKALLTISSAPPSLPLRQLFRILETKSSSELEEDDGSDEEEVNEAEETEGSEEEVEEEAEESEEEVEEEAEESEEEAEEEAEGEQGDGVFVIEGNEGEGGDPPDEEGELEVQEHDDSSEEDSGLEEEAVSTDEEEESSEEEEEEVDAVAPQSIKDLTVICKDVVPDCFTDTRFANITRLRLAWKSGFPNGTPDLLQHLPKLKVRTAEALCAEECIRLSCFNFTYAKCQILIIAILCRTYMWGISILTLHTSPYTSSSLGESPP